MTEGPKMTNQGVVTLKLIEAIEVGDEEHPASSPPPPPVGCVDARKGGDA
jgi:hypothetical protein